MASPADGGAAHLTPSQKQAREAYAQWEKFFNRALMKRLDLDKFADFAPILKGRHRLGPVPLADLFLRPTPWNRWTLDPRVPHYLQTLLDQRMVDVPAVLAGLYRYSTAHEVVGGQQGVGEQQQDEKNKGIKSEGDEGDDSKQPIKKKEIVRWQSSFSSEEVIFYRLTKAVAQGTAIKNSKDAVDISIVMARWMSLFTAASTAFVTHDEDVIMGDATDSASRQKRDDMDNARAAFVMLLLNILENPIVLQALSKPFAKGKL